MSQIIYRRDAQAGAVMVVEEILSDRSRAYDVHMWLRDLNKSSVSVFSALNAEDAMTRADKIAEALS